MSQKNRKKNCKRKNRCNASDWDYETDFIVVGMGAAGAVVTRMLSDANFYVIGIEAGGNYDNDTVIIDSIFAPILEPQYTWKYFYNQETAPNPAVNNRTLNYTTGRALGGGTTINGLQYVRGSDNFWNNWQSINGNNWGPAAALAGYKALENFVGVPGNYNPLYHGTNGLMKIRQAPVNPSQLNIDFVNALTTVTSPPSPVITDYNDPTTPIGSFTRWSLFEQPNGDRASSSTDFLYPILNNNNNKHRILLNTTVTKILFCDCNYKRAIGVEALHNGKCIRIKASKEVILSCGIFSFEVLQHSGIGSATLLNSLDIPIVYGNNNVGAQSKNQLINIAVITGGPTGPNYFPGTGTDPQSLYVGGAFLPDPTGDPNIRGFQWIGVDAGPGTLVIAFYKLNPRSTGYTKIQDKDPLRPVDVHEQLFNDPSDLASIVAVYQQQIPLLLSSLSPLGFTLISPDPSLLLPENQPALEAFIKDTLDHTHHWTGTCKMAPLNQGGVVDNQGNVYGVNDLRVVDVSVAPIEPDGNTGGPAFFIGYNIATMIINKYT